MDNVEHCVASPINGGRGSYEPTETEKKDFCNNVANMRFCPRLDTVLRHIAALNKGSVLSNVNTNLNNNTNSNSVNINEDLKESFELAYAVVEAKKDITEDEKDLINGRILVLEKEVAKGRERIDSGKIQRLRATFEKYAWLAPVIIDIVKKALE
jgi:hypothetical protein